MLKPQILGIAAFITKDILQVLGPWKTLSTGNYWAPKDYGKIWMHKNN